MDKHAIQSGTLDDFGPERAVDGFLENAWDSGYCSVITPDADKRVWWMVDLQQLHVLASVAVYGQYGGNSRKELTRKLY